MESAERSMPDRVKKSHPALRHAGYSTITVLPGESAAQFENLRRKLIDELTPNGALEEDIVATMARVLWRKQNVATCRIAELARRRCEQLKYQMVPRDTLFRHCEVDPAEREAAIEAAEDQARKELGDAYELVEMGTATVNCLMNDLAVLDRLDGMVDKCLKRLLFLRGLKSLSAPSSSAPRASPSATTP
jgi:hypothetical protein